MLSVRLSDDLESRLDALSKRTNRSKSFYVKKAIQQFLENEEEYARAEAAYSEYIRTGKKSNSLDDVMKNYETD